MPTFYFDLKFDGETPPPDENGDDLPNLEAAQVAAARTLADFSKEFVANRATNTFAVIVRDDLGPVLEATLTFDFKRRNRAVRAQFR